MFRILCKLFLCNVPPGFYSPSALSAADFTSIREQELISEISLSVIMFDGMTSCAFRRTGLVLEISALISTLEKHKADFDSSVTPAVS